MAIAAIAAVMLALMALLFAYGASAAGKSIAQLFPESLGVSVATIHPRAWVESAIAGVESAVHWIMGELIRPVINFILSPVFAVINTVESIYQFAGSMISALGWITETVIPEAYAWIDRKAHIVRILAEQYAADALTSAQHAISAAIGTTEAYAHRAAQGAWDHADGLYHAAEADIAAALQQAYLRAHQARVAAQEYTDTAIAALSASIGQALSDIRATVTSDTDALTAALASTAAALTNQIQSLAASIVATVQGVLITDIGHGAAAVEQDLTDAVSGAITAAEGDFGDITSWVKDIPLTKALDLAGVTAMSIATAGTLTRYLDDCGIPNCRNLGKFGQELSELGSLIGSTELLALLALLISNPVAGANELDSALGPIIGTAQSVIAGIRAA